MEVTRLPNGAGGQPFLPDFRAKYHRRKMKMIKIGAAIALLAMAILTLSCGVQAEETEEPQTANVTAEEKPVSYMFVQNAQSGTLIPVAGEDNLYTLTLRGTSPQTVAFSDTPERVVVQAPMQKFLDGMCFSPKNGPNAALEILEAAESADVVVVELFDPEYDALNQTLKYNVSILEQPDHSYAAFNERADRILPQTFGPAALFIDDCPDGYVYCAIDSCDNICGSIWTGCCWHLGDIRCHGCHSKDYYSKKCKEKYGSSCARVCDKCSI
jgi:hypothetical protein